MNDKPTRRELLRPLHLLAIAFACAAFSGVVTAIIMGAFQSIPAEDVAHAWTVALIVTGITFIVVLLGLSLLILSVDPSQVQKSVDRPVLLPDEETSGDDTGGAPAPDGTDPSDGRN